MSASPRKKPSGIKIAMGAEGKASHAEQTLEIYKPAHRSWTSINTNSEAGSGSAWLGLIRPSA
jgi:hypothetical protein